MNPNVLCSSFTHTFQKFSQVENTDKVSFELENYILHRYFLCSQVKTICGINVVCVIFLGLRTSNKQFVRQLTSYIMHKIHPRIIEKTVSYDFAQR